MDTICTKCSYYIKNMIKIETPLDGFYLIANKVYEDTRGFFLETYQKKRYNEFGMSDDFVQDNQSRSMFGVLRGMHYQIKNPQAQLLTVLRGRVFDVVVDLRPNSATFGKWHGVELSDSGIRQAYMSPGFAHGYVALTDWVDLHYKVTRNYDSNDEGGLFWNDPHVNIKWPKLDFVISDRDSNYPCINSIEKSKLPNI